MKWNIWKDELFINSVSDFKLKSAMKKRKILKRKAERRTKKWREKRGIEETRDIIDFVFSFVEAVSIEQKQMVKCHGVMQDISLKSVKKLFEAVDDIEEVLPEIEDLTDEEYDELVEPNDRDWIVDVKGSGTMTKRILIGSLILQSMRVDLVEDS